MARILVVDDSPVQMLTLRRMLERHGHTVFEAENGRIALDQAARHRPDLILMDILMPDLDGLETTRLLGAEPTTADIPVIIVSGKDEVVDKGEGTGSGARGYLTKPPRETDLVSLIDSLAIRA